MRSHTTESRISAIAFGANAAFLLVAFLQPTHWLLALLAIPIVSILPGLPIIRTVLRNLHPTERWIAIVLTSFALSTITTLVTIRVTGPATPQELALVLTAMNVVAYALPAARGWINARYAT